MPFVLPWNFRHAAILYPLAPAIQGIAWGAYIDKTEDQNQASG